MAYDLSNITSKKPSPYISYGGPQMLKINQIELVKSNSTGSVKAVLHMETKPVDDPDFEPAAGAKGKVGKVGCGVYMKHEGQKKEFFEKMLDIARALGLQDEFHKIQGDSFEGVVSEIENLFKGKNNYANYVIFGEEYSKSNGTIGLRLMFPRWNFVEPLEVKESRLTQFDANNPLHLKKIERVEETGKFESSSKKSVSEEVDDLPF